MTFKPAIWYPIAVLLSIINLGGVWFAVRTVEPWHATIHAALVLGFGVWAYRLRHGLSGSEVQARLEALEAEAGRLEGLDVEVSKLRQELNDAGERLDFAERLLAHEAEARRVGPERPGPPR